MASLSDFLFSGVLVRYPTLTLAYSEGQIGWLPYILERADDVWVDHRAWHEAKDTVLSAYGAFSPRMASMGACCV